jgi:hypothetical protein
MSWYTLGRRVYAETRGDEGLVRRRILDPVWADPMSNTTLSYVNTSMKDAPFCTVSHGRRCALALLRRRS